MPVTISVTTNTQQVIRNLEASQFAIVQGERNAMREIRDGVLQEYKRTTATWRHKPYFNAYQSGMGNVQTVRVGTDDKIYKFVEHGTRAHIIMPKKPGGLLRFVWGGHGSYVSKSLPGYISSRVGGASGRVVFRQMVHHPGTEARNFTELIQNLWNRKSREVMERHVRIALERNPFSSR